MRTPALAVLATLFVLTGCGQVAVPAAPVAPVAMTAQGAFNEHDYAPVSVDGVNKFWDRAGSQANDGKRFAVSGEWGAVRPDNFLEGWGATMSSGKEYAWIVTGKRFLSEGSGNRWFKERGTGTGETVTIYFQVHQSSNTSGRIEIEAVKRANGQLVRS